MDKLDSDFLKAALRDIGLALNACHNTVATDSYAAAPGEKSWRIDNSKEIEMVRKLERALLPNTGSDRENNMSEAARIRTDAQRKARALLRDIAAAGDDGVAIVDPIFGPPNSPLDSEVADALSGLADAGTIYLAEGTWTVTCLGWLAAAHAHADEEAQP